ncbi:MAG: alpha/beta fold hydrolase [Deltaproteobacteria bacterium]|nr:alpha/beta fold hydrolase [Deltaproteobacteria bacterium]
MSAAEQISVPTAPSPDGPRPHGPKQAVNPAASSWAEEYPFGSNWINQGTEQDPLWQHYLDEGDKNAPVLLMLHGNPTWSFMYRNLVKELSGRFRCIVPDHMGCGLSDRPQDWDYTLQNHASNVEALLDELNIKNYTLMCHDWGGMIGTAATVNRPDALDGMVVLNTGAFLGKLPKRIKTVRIPVFGRTAVLGFNAFVKAALIGCTHHKEKLTAAIKDGYLAPYSNAHDRIATLRFVEDVPQKAGHSTWDLVDEVDKKLHTLKEKPMLICWGERDWCFTPEFRKGWEERFPDAEVHAMDDAAHFVFEDAHERITEWMNAFFDKNGLGSQDQNAQGKNEENEANA